MLVLALDTTTRPGSVAILRDADLLAVMEGDPGRAHAERLPGDIVRLLVDNSLEIGAVDVFAVAAGPGSFTGLRIGIATIQGLAFALGRPVVGVSCLDALAVLALEWTSDDTAAPGLIGAFMDAQRSEVFAALYRPTGGQPGTFEVLDGPISEPPALTLDRWMHLAAGRTIRLAGDGVFRYRNLIDQQTDLAMEVVEPLPPLAPVIARLALAEAKAGRAVAPHAIRPIYVRRSDAELARERDAAQPSRGPTA